MNVRELVGLNIQRLRRERGISQEELAFQAPSSRSYLSGVESGRRNASLQLLENIARVLDVEVIDFFAALPGHRSQNNQAKRPPPAKPGPPGRRRK
jgi:transcriptional regulator with XRE-family HTH domain